MPKIDDRGTVYVVFRESTRYAVYSNPRYSLNRNAVSRLDLMSYGETVPHARQYPYTLSVEFSAGKWTPIRAK